MGCRSVILFILFLIPLAALILLALLIYQGRKRPVANAPYVALGSSFAAGLGLGARAPGSPMVCQRSVNGYPQLLARMTGLALTDMSCSGATVQHVVRGGQVFLGPQIDGIGPDTELVTLTAGGNDISYVGDLMAMAQGRRGGVAAFLVNRFWYGAKPVADRKFDQLQADLVAGLLEIRRRAPKAMVIVVTYPTILPDQGSCSKIGIDDGQADLMRSVAQRLHEVTVTAGAQAGALVVDMAGLSQGHDACAALPWVNGIAPVHGAPFHPTLAGAQAAADQIMQILK